ncbi:unnamed protein product, partial [Phaeothamnion confervicola]
MLTSVTDGIGWLIKSRGVAILPLCQSELLPWVWPLLAGSGGSEAERSLAMCVCIDILEHCGEGATPLAAELTPVLLQAVSEESSAIQQAAVYGLGVAAEKGGIHF